METMLIILSVVFLCCALFFGQRWMQARAAAAEAAAAREAAERRAAELETRLAAAEADSRTSRDRSEAEIRTLLESRSKAEAEVSTLTRRMTESAAEREKAEELLRVQFRNLANDILGEQSRSFKETNREALDVLLKPFRDNIMEFRTRVEQIYSTER